MIVHVLSYYDFNKLNIGDTEINKLKNIFIISILDSSGMLCTPLFEREHNNVLTLVFDDVVSDGERSRTVKGNTIAYTEEQNRILFDFIQRNKDMEICYVHCTAGVSRSGAVGTFINDLYGEDHKEYIKRNPMVSPNPMILGMLERIARKRP